MPGKHAPGSSKSFLISLGTAVGGALVALAVVVGIALVALNAGKEKGSPAITRSNSPAASITASGTATATGSASATASPSASSSLHPVSETPVAVLNGTKRAGLARSFSARVKAEGYPVPRVASGSPTAKSTIYYRAGSEPEAREFQRRFSEFTVIEQAPDTFAKDVVLTVVVGDDFPTPTPSPSGTASSTASSSP